MDAFPCLYDLFGQLVHDHLIADVQVPFGFKVMGYIDPYFYSEFICDEDNENLEIYRFKL